MDFQEEAVSKVRYFSLFGTPTALVVGVQIYRMVTKEGFRLLMHTLFLARR